MLAEARHSFGEDRNVAFSQLAGLEVAQWQQARVELEMRPHRFEETIRSFRSFCERLFAVVAVATSRYASISESAALKCAEQIRDAQCPDTVAETIHTDAALLPAALVCAAGILEDEKEQGKGLALLSRALRAEAARQPKSWTDLRMRGVPRRELGRFVDFDAEQRADQASAAVAAVIKVATALASTQGETFGADHVTDNRVLRISTGWRVNPFAVGWRLI